MDNLIKNLQFWDSVQATDPTMTKSMKVGGQQRTGVDAQYKKKMITKKFGMYGMGWGVDAKSEQFERQNYEDQTIILHYRAVAFYVVDNERYEFPLAASIKEAYVTNQGKGYLKIDDEAIKKVRTDALTKGFTDLGFNTDIHMGMFEDQNYIISQHARFELEKEEFSSESVKKAIEDISVWVNKEITSAKTLLPKNVNGFNSAMKRTRDKLIQRCQANNFSTNKYTKHLDEIAEQALSEIQQEVNKNED